MRKIVNQEIVNLKSIIKKQDEIIKDRENLIVLLRQELAESREKEGKGVLETLTGNLVNMLNNIVECFSNMNSDQINELIAYNAEEEDYD